MINSRKKDDLGAFEFFFSNKIREERKRKEKNDYLWRPEREGKEEKLGEEVWWWVKKLRKRP
jgi:hypothetical protein